MSSSSSTSLFSGNFGPTGIATAGGLFGQGPLFAPPSPPARAPAPAPAPVPAIALAPAPVVDGVKTE